MGQESEGSVLTIQRLPRVHALTKEIAKLFEKRLRSYLETMAPLLRPRRFLGDLVEGAGREPVVGAEGNFAELQELYRSIAQKTFDLRPELHSPIESISTQIQLHPWEYIHNINSDKGWESIFVTAPLTWTVCYSSPYTLSMFRQVMAGKHERDNESVRAFVLRACVLNQLFVKFPGLSELLEGLRFRVEVRRSPQLGELPLVTISAPFATIRPSDELVLMASGLAGGATFAEVIDLETVRALPDPLQHEVSRILKDAGETI